MVKLPEELPENHAARVNFGKLGYSSVIRMTLHEERRAGCGGPPLRRSLAATDPAFVLPAED